MQSTWSIMTSLIPARRPVATALAGAALALICAAAAVLSTAVPARAGGRLPVRYDFAAGAAATAGFPRTPPPGADNWRCKPGPAHPYPVVLVHGTFANMDDNWQTASPVLVNHGYCVFAFNYGGVSPSSPVQGTGNIVTSAAQLATFVAKVRAATGANKVDLVGHSQGGMMPRYYIGHGGASAVHALVALAPSNHGTTLDGIESLAAAFKAASPAEAAVSPACAACSQQMRNSAFLRALNEQPAAPGVRYTVIESKDDEVVTPYTSAFLPADPDVTDITLQDQCPADHSDHLEIASDPVAMADMLNALDPGHRVPVPCVPVLPAVGPAGPVPAF